MDRWNVVATLNYLDEEAELEIVKAKCEGDEQIFKDMINLANLTRNAFMGGDISTVMSPRTVLTWAENWQIFGDLEQSFKLTFLNKCDQAEKEVITEFYQRCFGDENVEKLA